MKTRTIILLAISALVTLSFTFASVSSKKLTNGQKTEIDGQKAGEEPAGGLVYEDK